MKCNHCKKTIPDGSIFCPYCGKRIDVVPESWKCSYCNLDIPVGTRLCPNCGNPISFPHSTDYGRCGTEREKVEKSYSYDKGSSCVENRYQSWYDQSDKQNVGSNCSYKAEKFYQQSKNYINDKVRPHFDERINELKNVDWKEKKKKSVIYIKDFLSDTIKLRKATLVIAVISILWFFLLNDGFSASWMWWVAVIMVIGAAFKKVQSLSEARKLFAATLFFGICFIVYSPKESGILGISDEELYNSSSQQVPSWLTKWKFVCETGNGGKIIVRLFDNGSATMRLATQTGASLRGYYNGNAVDMEYNGTYAVQENYVYLLFAGMSEPIALKIDEEEHRLYSDAGGIFKQSI